ncbi:MAG: hypothetical protein ACO1TE_24995 [Prosthecobacter sp.]
MRFHLLFLLTLFAALASTVATAQEENWQVPVTVGKDGWMLHKNARFGSVLPVPPGMVALRPPDNGDGQTFASADGKVTLAAWGAFNVDGNGDLEPSWQAALAEPGRTITYKVKKAGWYVISGVMKDGTGFYERHTASSKYVAGWKMTYPQAEEKKYSPWVERIAKGYEARLGQGVDRLE